MVEWAMFEKSSSFFCFMYIKTIFALSLIKR